MKRRVAPILTFTIALVLVSSLAYAAKKKDLGRTVDKTREPTQEEETLTAELLEATENADDKLSSTGDDSLQEIAQATPYKKVKGMITAKQPQK
jgi:hypothetical protein